MEKSNSGEVMDEGVGGTGEKGVGGHLRVERKNKNQKHHKGTTTQQYAKEKQSLSSSRSIGNRSREGGKGGEKGGGEGERGKETKKRTTTHTENTKITADHLHTPASPA
jgi:hypothetical protein